ncbi:MAG: hypothetical protein WD402_03745 [Chloroflexota bacterium]
MTGLRRFAMLIGVALVVGGAYAAWYIYGAWPVPDGYAFPRHSIWGSGPGALFEGELVEVDGCIETTGDDSSTVVWPPGYFLRVQDGQPVVHGSWRELRMGESVRMGGGWYSTVPPTGFDIGGCPPPFFLSTGFVED